LAASDQVEEVLFCQVSAGCVVEAKERGWSASRVRKGRWSVWKIKADHREGQLELSQTLDACLHLHGSDCPSPRHPLSVSCTYPTDSYHCVLVACTNLTVGHVLAQSGAVGLHAVAGLEVGILR
jgi:hypothetical protein